GAQVEGPVDLGAVEHDSAAAGEAAIEHEFAGNADACCEQGRTARHGDARAAQPHLVAHTRAWEAHQALDRGTSHEPAAADVGTICANSEVAAAANRALSKGDLTFDASPREANVAGDVAPAHDPVSANVHGIGFESPAAALDPDVACVD